MSSVRLANRDDCVVEFKREGDMVVRMQYNQMGQPDCKPLIVSQWAADSEVHQLLSANWRILW